MAECNCWCLHCIVCAVGPITARSGSSNRALAEAYNLGEAAKQRLDGQSANENTPTDRPTLYVPADVMLLTGCSQSRGLASTTGTHVTHPNIRSIGPSISIGELARLRTWIAKRVTLSPLPVIPPLITACLSLIISPTWKHQRRTRCRAVKKCEPVYATG